MKDIVQQVTNVLSGAFLGYDGNEEINCTQTVKLQEELDHPTTFEMLADYWGKSVQAEHQKWWQQIQSLSVDKEYLVSQPNVESIEEPVFAVIVFSNKTAWVVGFSYSIPGDFWLKSIITLN